MEAQLLRRDDSNLGELTHPEVAPTHGPAGVLCGLTFGLLVEEGWRKMSNSPTSGLKFLVSRGIWVILLCKVTVNIQGVSLGSGLLGRKTLT